MANVGLVEMLTELKIISYIRQHERFSTTGSMIRIEPEGKFQPIWRWLFGEARDNNIIELTKIINRATATFDAIEDGNCLRQLHTELTAAKKGLLNLKITYEQDSVMVAKLQVLCDSIDRTLDQKSA